MKQLTIGLVVFLLLCAGGTRVEAQEVASSFEQLAVLVKPGDKISVIDVTGRETRGRVGKLSSDLLILDTSAGLRQLGEVDVAAITQRRSDSLKNGAIIGAAAGAVYFAVILAILTETSDGGGPIVPAAIVGGVLTMGMGAAAGAGIDALISRRQVIYQNSTRRSRVSVSPMFGNGRRGAAVTVKF